VKFTVTPLGGGRTNVAAVVESIVRYLQPKLQAQPERPPIDGSTSATGPDRYYADSGEEPGRWLGQAAGAAGLSGAVDQHDFAAVLSGRDPHTGERLITAQGSAGRRPSLGSGAHTKYGVNGVPLYGVADAAAVLGVTQREMVRMLDIGGAVAIGRLSEALSPQREVHNGHPSPAGPPVGHPARPPDEHPAPDTDSLPDLERPPILWPPAGSFVVPLIDGTTRWISEHELERCLAARAVGIEPADLRALGDPTDVMPIGDAARIIGVTSRYLRGLARHHEEHHDEIARTLESGRRPRRAFLDAQRGENDQWFVTRDRLVEFLQRRRPPAVRVAYDVTLTTEKSLGVLALVSDTPTQAAVLGAIQAGNDWAVDWLEDNAGFGRVEGKPVKASGWTVASYRHLTSRSLDPFPHHHNVVANSVRLEDGSHRALDARHLYHHAHAASALATAEMRHQLSYTLGVRWRPGRSNGWEIDGIDGPVLREFSQRRNEIDDALQELEAEIGRGAHPREVEHIVLRTRPAKNHTPTDQLVDAWQARAAIHGLTPERFAAITSRPRVNQDVDREQLFGSLAAPDGICASRSVFSRADALATLGNHPVESAGEDGTIEQPFLGGATRLIELTDQFLASGRVVALTTSGEPLYTTVEMLAVQERISNAYVAGLHQGAHLVDDARLDAGMARHPHLTAQQQHLARTWCQRGHRIHTAIGRAGAGKTTTVAACADAWTAAGYRVLGAAVKGEATRTLAAATGIECETVAWYLAHTDPGDLPIDARTILVIDEASTLSDRDLDALINMAATTGASLRLIGDPAQHGSIAAGGMFRVLCERNPAQTPELTTTHRLQNRHDRAAAEALRDGRIDEAFDQLAQAGHLHVVDDDLTMYRHILGRWWDAHLSGHEHPMVDRRNSTRRQLNRLAHLLRHANGELSGEPVAASGGRTFAIGDRVTARAPNRQLHVDGDRHAYIRNGALGTVTAIHHDGDPRHDALTIDFDGIGRIGVPRGFFDQHRTASGRTEVGIDHAYALTSYAVQGSTRDVSTSRIDATASRAETYVDITRGRHANHLFLTTATEPLDGEALPRVPTDPADVAVAERLHRSTGELTAWEVVHSQAHDAMAIDALGR
jgi:conjugative relaxase-like TrwC/TraI family protein